MITVVETAYRGGALCGFSYSDWRPFHDHCSHVNPDKFGWFVRGVWQPLSGLGHNSSAIIGILVGMVFNHLNKCVHVLNHCRRSRIDAAPTVAK